MFKSGDRVLISAGPYCDCWESPIAHECFTTTDETVGVVEEHYESDGVELVRVKVEGRNACQSYFPSRLERLNEGG